MKKLIISIIFALGFGMSLNAQNDGFFTASYDEYREDNWSSQMPSLPGFHGGLDDYNSTPDAPLGSGLFILSALACLWMKSNENE